MPSKGLFQMYMLFGKYDCDELSINFFEILQRSRAVPICDRRRRRGRLGVTFGIIGGQART